jgi:hypothetical protein
MKFLNLLALLLIAVTTQVHAQSLSNKELSKRVEILADEINQLKAYQMFINKNESAYGLSPSASKVYHIPQGLSVGGYGEITYRHFRSQDQNGDHVDQDPVAEVLRNIIYLGYKFNDKWLINMELEIEHVSQVYTEFMYLDYLHSDAANFRAGLMLHPIGFVNELHEPTVFNGVLRPQVETKIIPTTWRSLGVGLFGSSGKSTYKVYAMNGMNAEGFSTSSNRGARNRGGHYDSVPSVDTSDQKEGNQRASTGALVWRYDFQATDSFMLGTSGLVGAASGEFENLEQRMASVHFEYTKKAHRVRFLAVENRFLNANQWNTQENINPGAGTANLVNTAQTGAYIEYQYTKAGSGGSKIVPFLRYEMLNLRAEVEDEFGSNADALEMSYLTAGINYFPLDRVVFKLDYTRVENKADNGVDEIAMGIGYNF